MTATLDSLRSFTLRAPPTATDGLDLHGEDSADGEDFEYHHTIPADCMETLRAALGGKPGIDVVGLLRIWVPVLVAVLLHDIAHNTDRARTASLTESERERFAQKYCHARAMLGG